MHVNKCIYECNPFDVDFSNDDYCEMGCRYSQCWRKYTLYLNVTREGLEPLSLWYAIGVSRAHAGDGDITLVKF